jgi:hypothetical protein
LLRADAKFSTSPDHCEISILFDTYRIETPAALISTPATPPPALPRLRPPSTSVKVSAPITTDPERRFELAGAHGRSVTIDARGALSSAEAIIGTVTVTLNGTTIKRTVKPSEPFTLHFTGALGTAGATNMIVSLNLPASDKVAQLELDSLDIALARGGTCK